MPIKDRLCPKCTYPLRYVYVTDEVRMIMCTNKRCDYCKKSPKKRRINGV